MGALRQRVSRLRKALYRVGQTLSRDAADSHLEAYVSRDFLDGDYGGAYGVTRADRQRLLARMRSIADHIPSATRMLYHLVLARELLKIPPSALGDVIECGAYKGASSASLSHVCELVRRKLWICDSFAGLPVAEADVTRSYPHFKAYGHYRQGMYAGSLAEVQENVRRYGDIDRCEFVPGLFSDTLPDLRGQLVFAFVDVDLTSSMQDCIRHIWPRLVDEGYVYTDDSCDMEVIRVWFDDRWWERELGQRAPGYVGTGCGLPLSLAGSSLGYAQKIADVEKSYKKGAWF